LEKNNREILVVDDEENLCNIVGRVLESEGYNVRTACDGRKALQLTREKEPDLILLDIMMPGINGERSLPDST
jgi:CheY-like chemotaxis protein